MGAVGLPGNESRVGAATLSQLQRWAFPENGAPWQDLDELRRLWSLPGSLCDTLSLHVFICKMGQETSLCAQGLGA